MSTGEILNLIFRLPVLIMAVIIVLRQSYLMLHTYSLMSPAMAIRSYAFMGFAASAGWGISELWYKDIPIGPRNVILLFVCILATVAVLLPDKYQQFQRPDKEKK